MATAAQTCIRLFESVQMPLGPGISGEQLDQIESEFGFSFAQDHRELLSLATPKSEGWLDWQTTSAAEIQARLDWPLESILWDAHNNNFWPPAWGRKPKRDEDLDDAVKAQFELVPKLVPLFGHRFMPAGPGLAAAPVFSVYGSDVIYYGENLPDYVAHEMGIRKRFASSARPTIPFWTALAEGDRRYAGRAPKRRAFWNRSILGGPALPTETSSAKRPPSS
jgi:hypothetical protein